LRLGQRSHLARTEDNLNAAFPVRALSNLAALQTSRREELEDAGLSNPVRLRWRLRQHSHLARTEDNLNAAFPVRAPSNLAALQTRRNEDLQHAGPTRPSSHRLRLRQRSHLARTEDNLNAAFPVRAPSNLAALQTS